MKDEPIGDACPSERITLYMIVMKFGGTSVESSDAIARLVGTVNAHLAQRLVVVVSALGKTTNKLLEFAETRPPWRALPRLQVPQ